MFEVNIRPIVVMDLLTWLRLCRFVRQCAQREGVDSHMTYGRARAAGRLVDSEVESCA